RLLPCPPRTGLLIGLLVAVGACGGSDSGTANVSPGPDAPPREIILTACSTEQQSGCDPGYKCTLYLGAAAMHACELTRGSVTAGGACRNVGGIDDCAGGLICNGGVCLKLCESGAGCGAGGACQQTFAPGDGICRATGCDLFDESTCEGGQGCDVYPSVGSSAATFPSCRPSGN